VPAAVSSPLRLVVAALVAIALTVPLAPPAVAQESAYLELIQTAQGRTTVRAGDVLLVEGWAPGGTVTAVRLLGTRADGTQFAFDYPGFVPQGDGSQTEWVRREDDGSINGRIAVPCQFDYEHRFASDRPCASDVEVWRAQLEISVGGQTLRSNRGGMADNPGVWRVDSLHPVIRRYEQLALDRIRVVFTEPVRLPGATTDSPVDWRVENAPTAVRSIEGPFDNDCVYPAGEDPAKGATGCTRILTLDPPLPADVTPIIAYNPGSAGNVSFRDAYRDFANNSLRYGHDTGTNPSAAIDLVRPAIPSIREVAGRATGGGAVVANEPSPQIRVENLEKGDDLTVTATGPAGTLSKTVTVTEDAPITSPGGGAAATVTLEGLTDGTYVVRALAVDPEGNRSDESEKGPARSDGSPNPVTYVLDTVPPRAVAAAMQTRREILVVFNESVTPEGNAGRWTVDGQDASASGSGDRRRVTTSSDIDGPGVVEWRPESIGPLASRYNDAAGNEMQTVQITAIALPAIVSPTVLQPAAEAYTKTSSQVISGTSADSAAVDLLERATGTRLASTSASNGAWSFSQSLPVDGRYRFDVQTRDDATGSRSARAPVPDIVRDTVAPLLTVLSPALEPSPTQPDGRPRRGIGGMVTVEWLGTDPAPTDPARPDHGAGVDIDIVFDANTKRPIARNEAHAPGQPRTFSYTITEGDLAGLGTREARFEVTLRDLAGNATSVTSAPILIVGDLLDYGAVLVERGVIEARFPVALTGETTGAEWLVDGKPAQNATREQRDGQTVVRIFDATVRDPNATPTLRYQPVVSLSPLRGPGGGEISTATRLVADGIAPALAITARDAQGVVVDSDRVRFAGTTDGDTAKPNTIQAFTLDGAGNLSADPAASVQADPDGKWRFDVPLAPDRRNEIVIRATDPNSNRSQTLPQPPALVIEDSTPPVVNITAPAFGAPISQTVPLRWSLVEANLLELVVDYRIDGGEWQRLQQSSTDPGSLSFDVPADFEDKTLGFRVTATDMTGKTGEAAVDGLRLTPPELTRVRATGAKVVAVTFSQPVTTDGSGFSIDGASVRRVKGDGLTRTFILDRALTTTTPMVEYTGTSVTNDAGLQMEPVSMRARRSFAFAVTTLRGQRVSTNRVRVTWADSRNRPGDLRGYRIYRDGSAIALVGASTKAFTDRRGKGRHVYTVRAVDDRRRVSSVRRVVVRR
jgi:hypothetical protein